MSSVGCFARLLVRLYSVHVHVHVCLTCLICLIYLRFAWIMQHFQGFCYIDGSPTLGGNNVCLILMIAQFFSRLQAMNCSGQNDVAFSNCPWFLNVLMTNVYCSCSLFVFEFVGALDCIEVALPTLLGNVAFVFRGVSNTFSRSF